MHKTEAAYRFSCNTLAEQGPIYLWTFTFKDVIPIKEARKRWNHALTLLRREWPRLRGIRVFELHEEHGLHVHLLVDRYLPADELRPLTTQAGWARIHVKPYSAQRARYLAKFLSAKRPGCLKGIRLWAPFGPGWNPTKTRDVEKESPFTTIYRACAAWLGWTGSKGFLDRIKFVNRMYDRTIEEGWEPGLGPGRKPYPACTGQELGLGPILWDFRSFLRLKKRSESSDLA